MSAHHNKDRGRPVYSATLPPNLISEVRRIAQSHHNTVSAEIERALRAHVASNSGKNNQEK